MLGTYADALQVAGAAGPWLGLALVLLGIAARVARSARASARSQGERIGALEQRANSERIRRQQVEAHLIGLGIRLPWWPADGRPQYEPPARYADELDDEDQADDEQRTSALPPVPPLPDFPRHRREARQAEY